MKSIISLILAILLISCEKKENIIIGDLYFKIININNFKGLSKNNLIKFEKYLNSKSDNLEQENQKKQLKDYYLKIKKLNLLNSNSFKLKSKNGEIKNFYINDEEFKKISEFDYINLVKKNNRIELTIYYSEIEDGIFICSEILNVEQIKGETKFEK